MDNRRRQYRVTAEFDRLVQVELLGPKVHATNVRLLDLSAGGAGIVLPSRASGVLRMRDRIELRLISAALTEPVRMFARISHLDEREREPTVGLEFESWREHRALLDSELKTLFNEREAFRVDPTHREPVELRIVGRPKDGLLAATRPVGARLSAPVEAQLRDISVTGLGVKLLGPLTGPWGATDGLRVEARLPGDSQGVTLEVELRYLRPHAEGVTLAGLRLTEDTTPHARRARAAVTRYVMDRQRAILRVGLRDEEPSRSMVRPLLEGAAAR
ncbi:MAG: PilZ domain-containing protein [Deltaproteobacteria bacterium]|jgi:c-di-GMP-binding flagellar brake protein YcgR|nr:PilZ domain-containing protein [Deltaproteobacteria bacterium]